MGLRLPLPVDATFIASLTWIGKIHLRVEEIAPSDAAAADTTESLQTILVLVKSMANTGRGDARSTAKHATLINSIAGGAAAQSGGADGDGSDGVAAGIDEQPAGSEVAVCPE